MKKEEKKYTREPSRRNLSSQSNKRSLFTFNTGDYPPSFLPQDVTDDTSSVFLSWAFSGT